jgi:hypothetical protein
MIKEHTLGLHREARGVKEHYWYEHGEADPPPLLSVRWRDCAPQSVDIASASQMVFAMHRLFPSLPLLGHEVAPDEEPREPLVLYIILRALDDGIAMPGISQPHPPTEPIEEIRFNVEGYAQKVEGDDEIAKLEHEAIHPEHDFKTNPASTVTETMVTYLVRTSPLGTAEWGRVTSNFKRGDAGRIVWEEPQIATSDDEQDPENFDLLLRVMTPIVTREVLT